MRRPFVKSIGIVVMGCWLQAVPASEPDLTACLTPPIQGPALTGDELDHWLHETGARLEKAVRTVAPEDATEMLAVLDIAGFDSPGLRDWVADNTGYIPYSGVLRGARGVLIERRGNSLDRALLLAELIAATGSDVRLAQGPAMVIESRPVVRPKADETVLGVDLLPSGQRAAAQAELARRADCDAATRTRIDQQTATLLALVGEPAAQGPATTEDAYWWVQVKDGDDWSDLFLDEFQGLEPTATATHAPDQLPTDLTHSVTFRFVAEVWNGWRAVHQTLLEHRNSAADLVSRDIHLGQRPEPTPALNAAVAASDTAALFTALDAAPVWTPEISVDGKSYTDRAVSLDGRTAKADRAGLASLGSEAATGAAALGGTGGGLLSGAFGGGGRGGLREGKGDGPRPALLAEWLEITISAPDEETRTQRRTLLDTLAGLRPEHGQPGTDLVGKAKLDGRGLALLTDIQAGMIGFDPSSAYLAREAAKVAASAVTAAVAIMAGDDAKPGHNRQLPLLAFANARMRMGGDQVYADHANLVLLRTSLRRGADGKLRLLRNADIVDNQVASRVAKPMTGRASGGGDSAFKARLRQGVADTVLETRWLKGQIGL